MKKEQLDTKDIIQWDIVNWSRCLHYWEKEIGNNAIDKNALEIGSGNGGLSLWLAKKGMRVVCSDISDPKVSAGNIHANHDFYGKITYEAIDATDIPYADYFDYIIFKSVLGGIGRNNRKDLQSKAIKQMRKCLKPGGKLLFAENLTGPPLHKYLRTKFVPWGESWRYVTIDEVKDLLSDFSDFGYKTWGFLGAFGRNEPQRSILGRLDSFLDFLVPASSRYIIYGAAVK